jgi:hypothetical protein
LGFSRLGFSQEQELKVWKQENSWLGPLLRAQERDKLKAAAEELRAIEAVADSSTCFRAALHSIA